MFGTEIAMYVGSEKENGFGGYIAENNWFLEIEVEEGLEESKGINILHEIKQYLFSQTIENLSSFEQCVMESFKLHNLPAGLSLSAGYLHGSVLYVKTIGTGSVHILRKNQFAQLIGDTQTASGFVEKDDLFIFSSSRFIEKSGGEWSLHKTIQKHKLHEAVEELTPIVKSNGDNVLIAIFVHIYVKELDMQPSNDENQIASSVSSAEFAGEPMFISKTKPWDPILRSIKQLYFQTQEVNGGPGKKKIYTFIAVVIISAILFWSVVLGYSRRKEAMVEKSILDTKASIQQDLNQADSSAFLDLSKSQDYINQAKSKLDELRQSVPRNKQQELIQIAAMISSEENKIVKKENKQYTEFYDLKVDNQKADGKTMYLDGSSLLILDSGQGVIYSLDIDKKSLDKQSDSSIRSAQLVAGYNGNDYFYTPSGLYEIETTGTVKKIIGSDPEWGIISSFWVYNGNVYVLSQGKDVYKYLVAENGYSAKSSYFGPIGPPDLHGAHTMAIDSSVYLGFDNTVKKYTGGAPVDFSTTYPDQDIHITKIYTDKDVNNVYVWDKQKGVLYILDKTGSYVQQIASSILQQGTDFVIANNFAYVLMGSKIYTVSLQ